MLKKKTFIMLLSFTLMLGSISVSAHSRLGERMGWYEKHFLERVAASMASLWEDFRLFRESTASDIHNYRNVFSNTISDFLANTVSKSNADIENYNQVYQERLSATQERLMSEDLEDEKESVKKRIDEDISEETTEILKDILSKN